MAQLEFTLERGGVLTAEIFTDLVPATWQAITAVMPVTWKIYNARWSGREVFTQCDLPNKPPRENQTIRASLGDVIFSLDIPDKVKKARVLGDGVWEKSAPFGLWPSDHGQVAAKLLFE